MENKWKLETTSMSLHLLAMSIMLCDHLKMLFPDVVLLSCIGRIAFPIFVFLIVEGYHHTRHLRRTHSGWCFLRCLRRSPSI